jgi:hypothetical protein
MHRKKIGSVFIPYRQRPDNKRHRTWDSPANGSNLSALRAASESGEN